MKKYYLYYIVLIILFFIICIGLYGYNSGSCKITKKYICNDNFCLYKEFKVYFIHIIQNEINEILIHKEIQKRVNIKTYPETILNCALPNKKGITISTQNVIKYAPNLIHFYKNELCKLVSNKINLQIIFSILFI